MTKKINQMAVRYRSLADGDDVAFKWESSLDKILTAGNYAVEIEHYGADVGLPIEDCGTVHSIVGTLVVTDSGALENKQGDRVMGQVLTFTLRESKETSIYTRTYAGGEWGEWCSLARTGMYDEITNADELYSTVSSLVSTTKELEDCLRGSIINYNEWKDSDAELSLPNVLADDEFVKKVKSGTILTFKNTSTTWKRFQYTAESAVAADVRNYSNWKELSGAAYGIKQSVDAGKVQISTTGENGAVKDILNIVAATTEKAGVMTAEDKKKLDDNVVALVAETARAHGAEAAAIEQGRKLALRDLFVAAGALYNDTGADIIRTAPWGESVTHKDGHYYLNGLGDITEKEMLDIYNAPHNALYEQAYARYDKLRTPLFIGGTSSATLTNGLNSIFHNCTEMEVIGDNSTYLYFSPNAGNVKNLFKKCLKLRSISIVMYVERVIMDNTVFSQCVSLKYVKISRLSNNLSFSDCVNIDKSSVLYAIEEARPTTAIAITLHADAYTRLINDSDIVAALEVQPLISLVAA